MPFDPAKPASGTPLSSAEIRAQLTALHDAILALPGVTGAQVDSTNTGPPGSAAGAIVSLAGGVLHFHFDVPQGAEGVPGTPGEVTQSQLNNDLSNVANFAIGQAMSVSSANSNAVQTLDSPMSNAEAEALRAKLNELVQALRR